MSQGFFVNGGGVGLEALRRRISEHLGPDIVIEPSTYNGIDGYILRASRPETIESLKDLVRRTGAISVGAYKTKSNVVVTTTPVQDDDSLEESEEEDQSTHKDRSRTPSGIGRYLSHSYRIGLNQLYRSKPCLALGRRMHFRNFVGPDRETAPQNDTVVWNLLLLAMYFIALCLAARFPTNKVRIIFISISGLAFTVLSASVIMDLASRDNRKYIRNLGNTTLTVLLSIPLMTALYYSIWYPQLNRTLMEGSQDIVTEARFPSVTLFQRLDWSAQPTILPVSYTKCFLGWLEWTGQACNCSEHWSSPVVEHFVWQNIAYRYLSFTPSAALVSSAPTYTMTLQVFFNYNATFSLKTSSQEQGPSLSMAVYDPSLDLTDALTRGYSRMDLISANGDVSINLGLQYRQAMDHSPAYDYTLGISTVPNLNLVCNTASNDSYPCHITLFLQMPTFSRTIITEKPAMSWMDVAASVGGWFSFVQVLSWLISGQAGAT